MPDSSEQNKIDVGRKIMQWLEEESAIFQEESTSSSEFANFAILTQSLIFLHARFLILYLKQVAHKNN